MIVNTEIEDCTLLRKLEHISALIGNTPIIPFTGKSEGIFAKLEYLNFTGSTKDRASLSILTQAIEKKLLNKNSTIIESTSGNFGISLAQFALALGINFIPVIDPNITTINKKALKFLCEKVIEVTEVDATGGYLLNRIKAVENYKLEHPEVFHPNQYKNDYNWMGYKSIAQELSVQMDTLDYIVIAVSTGGTITGVSREIKKYFPNIKVVGVDVKGSMVFQNTPQKRKLSGLGSSRKSDFIANYGEVDEAMIFDEKEILDNCKKMARNNAIFAGASSGAAYAAAQRLLKRHKNKDVKIMMICPDRGTSYVDNYL
ncbi:2,3-diaminopropionate biosynthesis protein SbnA [Postechiella marina]|uniref:2,3-diaminopropionate biosynthesis protein SbnA n=1 Tax=Postechiella marina TaxID=943941 RepID=A0ABP8CBZ2_9FLAO